MPGFYIAIAGQGCCARSSKYWGAVLDTALASGFPPKLKNGLYPFICFPLVDIVQERRALCRDPKPIWFLHRFFKNSWEDGGNKTELDRKAGRPSNAAGI